jgi:hypothetical protein
MKRAVTSHTGTHSDEPAIGPCSCIEPRYQRLIAHSEWAAREQLALFLREADGIAVSGVNGGSLARESRNRGSPNVRLADVNVL